MRIAVIVASGGMDEAVCEDRRRYLQGVVSPGTEIAMIPNPPPDPATWVSEYEPEWPPYFVAERAVEVERAGFDAGVIWCGDDPGLEAARERVRIPIVGPSEASLSIARQLGGRFSIVTSAGPEARVHRRVWNSKLASMLASVEILDIAAEAIRSDLTATRGAMVRAIEAARASGAHSIVLGCMAMYGMARDLSAELGLPVIDGGEAAVMTAEMLVRLGLSHSKLAFPYPPQLRVAAPV